MMLSKIGETVDKIVKKATQFSIYIYQNKLYYYIIIYTHIFLSSSSKYIV